MTLLPSFLPSVLPLSSFSLSLPLLLPSFFPSVHLSFILGLSVPSFLSPLPVLLSLPPGGTQGWLGRAWDGVLIYLFIFLRAQVVVGICQGRARVAQLSGAVDLGLVCRCRQGLGYDHDRMAAALRSYSAGRQPELMRSD